ncbi:MAG: hypothetical protein ACPG5B_11960 [Chitinophagales bacterium]
MKKIFKLSNIAFYLLMLTVFFFVGLYFAAFIEAGKDQMLAGGAIVLGWGVLFAGIAFIASFFIAYYVEESIIKRINWVLLVLLILFYGITHYRYLEREKARKKSDTRLPQEKTKPVSMKPASMSLDNATFAAEKTTDIGNEATKSPASKMGLGLFIPNIIEHSTLYFYGNVNLEKGQLDHAAQDSVVFAKDEHNNLTTTYAPPWLYPEHIKLDYGIMAFKVLGLGHDFLKAEANKKNKQITYLDKNRGRFVTWPAFFLSVNSVEFNESSTKKVFVKPLDYAGEVKVAFDFMQTLLVEEEWMYVRLMNDNLKEIGKGWIRWKKDNELLITYSLFS